MQRMQSTIVLSFLCVSLTSLTSSVVSEEDKFSKSCEEDPESMCNQKNSLEEKFTNNTSSVCDPALQQSENVMMNCSVLVNSTEEIIPLEVKEEPTDEFQPSTVAEEFNDTDIQNNELNESFITPEDSANGKSQFSIQTNEFIPGELSGENSVMKRSDLAAIDDEDFETKEGSVINGNSQNEEESTMSSSSTKETNNTNSEKSIAGEESGASIENNETSVTQTPEEENSTIADGINLDSVTEEETNLENKDNTNNEEQNMVETDATVTDSKENVNSSEYGQQTSKIETNSQEMDKSQNGTLTNQERTNQPFMDTWFWGWLFKSALPQKREIKVDSTTVDGEQEPNPESALIDKTDESSNLPQASDEEHFAQEANSTGTECLGQCTIEEAANSTQLDKIIDYLKNEISENEPGETTTAAIWNTDEYMDQTLDIIVKRAVDEIEAQIDKEIPENNTQENVTDPMFEILNLTSSDMEPNNSESQINIIELSPFINNKNLSDVPYESVPLDDGSSQLDVIYFLLMDNNSDDQSMVNLKSALNKEGETNKMGGYQIDNESEVVLDPKSELLIGSQEANTTEEAEVLFNEEGSANETEENSTAPWYSFLSLGEFSIFDFGNESVTNEKLPTVE